MLALCVCVRACLPACMCVCVSVWVCVWGGGGGRERGRERGILLCENLHPFPHSNLTVELSVSTALSVYQSIKTLEQSTVDQLTGIKVCGCVFVFLFVYSASVWLARVVLGGFGVCACMCEIAHHVYRGTQVFVCCCIYPSHGSFLVYWHVVIPHSWTMFSSVPPPPQSLPLASFIQYCVHLKF